jgi:hypothetical protein
MASNFPSSLDTFTNPSSSDALDSVSVPHASQHSDLNDAVEALQAKVGADSSGVASSHDYKIAALEAISHGKILQVVTATYSTSTANTTSTYADTGLSVSITPSSSSSKVLIIVDQGGCYKNALNVNNSLKLKLLRDSTDLVEFLAGGGYTGTALNLQFGNAGCVYLDSPATTSATTYKTQFANSQNTNGVTVQGSSSVSTIAALEVSA